MLRTNITAKDNVNTQDAEKLQAILTSLKNNYSSSRQDNESLNDTEISSYCLPRQVFKIIKEMMIKKALNQYNSIEERQPFKKQGKYDSILRILTPLSSTFGVVTKILKDGQILVD